MHFSRIQLYPILLTWGQGQFPVLTLFNIVLPLTLAHHGGLNHSLESASRREGCDAT